MVILFPNTWSSVLMGLVIVGGILLRMDYKKYKLSQTLSAKVVAVKPLGADRYTISTVTQGQTLMHTPFKGTIRIDNSLNEGKVKIHLLSNRYGQFKSQINDITIPQHLLKW